MSEAISPEERLFRIIQQGKKTADQGSPKHQKKTGGWFGGGRRFILPRDGSSTAGEWKEKVLTRVKKIQLRPEHINRILAVVLAVVLGLAVYAVSGKRKDVSVIANAVAKIRTLPAEDKKNIESLKELSFYLAPVKARDLFRASTKAPVVENMPKASAPLMKAAEGLKLQGISWGEAPKAMILWQDGKDNKMYFLVDGQAIGTTGLKVTKISKTSVKISDGKEETVLL